MNKFFAFILVMTAWCGIALAQPTYDIKEMTPEIKAALENRRARFGQLKAMKVAGGIGENNQGYVQVLKGGPASEDMVKEENVDRELIYNAIVQQNNLEWEALATVERVFADVQREKAAPGDQIQADNGNWMIK